VIVVNETFARSLFPNEDPIGKRISGWASQEDPQWREIIGVVGDVRAFGRENDMPPEIYAPLTQAPEGAWNAFNRSMAVVVKAPGAALGTSLRRAVSTVDPLVPLFDVQTMESVVRQSTATRRFNTLLLTFLGVTGLLLAAIGIYGVISFFVTQRTQEIGVRVALGASRGRVIRMVVQQALVLALLGVTAGALASFWAMRVFRTMLYEVGARDPVAFGAAAILLLLVAVTAAWLPARRAARVDPTKALAAAG
jgi:putative ABC transport system permease protein